MKGKSLIFNRLSPLGVDLLMRLIEINPKRRITIQEILSHPFLN